MAMRVTDRSHTACHGILEDTEMRRNIPLDLTRDRGYSRYTIANRDARTNAREIASRERKNKKRIDALKTHDEKERAVNRARKIRLAPLPTENSWRAAHTSCSRHDPLPPPLHGSAPTILPLAQLPPPHPVAAATARAGS